VYIVLSPQIPHCLTAIFLGLYDESKAAIRDIINEAKDLGSYEHLQPGQKQVLVNALEESRAVDDTGIVRRPMAQLHDTRVIMERVCREVRACHFSEIL
jgi:hypothetical protein